jgi:subtilisin family serine protease
MPSTARRATPHVTGVAALVLSRNTTWTPATVRDDLVRDACAPGVSRFSAPPAQPG